MNTPREIPCEHSFANFMLQKSRKETAFANYSHAGAALENAQIRERLAEIISQCEPLDSLSTENLTPRSMMYAAAFYVVVGRLPELT